MYMGRCICIQIYAYVYRYTYMYTYVRRPEGCQQSSEIYLYICTANPTWGDIFESSFKAQISKLERLFSLKRGKRDVRALSFEL